MIYLIEGAGLVKIGFAVDPVKRLRALQCGSPVALRLVGQMEGTKSDESRLHRAHRAARTHGEWFRRTDEIAALIEAHAIDPIDGYKAYVEVEKSRYQVSDQERERRRENMRRLHREGRAGGAFGKLGGRPSKVKKPVAD